MRPFTIIGLILAGLALSGLVLALAGDADRIAARSRPHAVR